MGGWGEQAATERPVTPGTPVTPTGSRTLSGGSSASATPRSASGFETSTPVLSPDAAVAARVVAEPTEREAMLQRVLATELRRFSTLLDVLLDGVRRLDAAVKGAEVIPSNSTHLLCPRRTKVHDA
jgi:hypothetical protein